MSWPIVAVVIVVAAATLLTSLSWMARSRRIRFGVFLENEVDGPDDERRPD